MQSIISFQSVLKNGMFGRRGTPWWSLNLSSRRHVDVLVFGPLFIMVTSPPPSPSKILAA
jgi:hypothetical protein